MKTLTSLLLAGVLLAACGGGSGAAVTTLKDTENRLDQVRSGELLLLLLA